MTTIKYVQWFIATLIGFAVVALIERIPLRKFWLRIIVFLGKFLLLTYIAYSCIALASPFLWKYNYLLMGLHIALLASCLADVVMLVVRLISKKDNKKLATAVLALLTAGIFVYGTVNMQMIKPHQLSYQSDKISKEHVFVFLADLHIGSAQSISTIYKALNEISELKPEFILLGGDLTDEHTDNFEMEWLYGQLGNMRIPVYFIYGNHDRQGRAWMTSTGQKFTEQELEETILKNGITVLKDDYAAIGDDIIILGREDVSHQERKAVEQLPDLSADKYVICVDHTPYQNEDIIKQKADLQLSGHTHAAQFWPMKFVYTLARLNVEGNYRIGDTDLYVSPGIAGWYLPFRTESHCYYEVITLKPAE